MLLIFKFLGKQPQPILFALSLALVLLIGVADHFAGPDISLLVFFMLPIFLAVWFVGKRAGLLVLVMSGAVWTAVALATSHTYAHTAIPYWNIISKLAFLLVFAHILEALKNLIDHERELARTDHVTGVANRRYFFEVADMEIKRARRNDRPFTTVTGTAWATNSYGESAIPSNQMCETLTQYRGWAVMNSLS